MTEALTHPRWTDSLGTPLDLYRGSVAFTWDSEAVAGEGQAWLGWLPSPRVFLSWGLDHPSGTGIDLGADMIDVTLPDVGAGGLVRLEGSPDPPGPTRGPLPVTLSGSVDRFVVGRPDEAVEEVRFVVVNGPELLGAHLEDGKGSFWGGRTVLEAGDWRFVLDQRRDMSSIKGELRWSHPFGLTHVGQLTRLDGAAIAIHDVREALDLLGYFLSFVRGAAAAPVLPCGLDTSGGTVWEDWGSAKRTVHPWRTTISWFDTTLTKHLPQLFAGFERRWAESDDQQVLRYALAFYQGSNDPRPLETGLTLAVTGLELMAWVYLVRDRTMPESDFDARGARQRTIKRLLDTVGIDTSRIPDQLPRLRTEGRLGHDALWDLRNRFTHPRMGTIATDHNLLGEAWRLATWYLDLVLLHWFDYAGPYGSRLKPGRWKGDTEPRPWAATGSTS